MVHPLEDLIDARTCAAQQDGAFDNLAGQGMPLAPQDDPGNAVLNRLIRESGGVSEFVSLSRELQRLRDELTHESDRSKRVDILKNMSMMDAKISIVRAGRNR